MTETVVITGSNRGIGLRLTRSYVEGGHRVFATCRSPEKAMDLARLAESSGGRLSVHPLDVTNEAQRDAFAATLQGIAVDVLINNAGVYPDKGVGFGNLAADAWLHGLHVNAIAPVLLAQALVDNVATSERRLIASITSKMGSIADNASGGSYAYRSSKTALNMAMKSLSIDLRDRGIAVIVMHPGWVKTDMGGAGAMIATDECVSQLRIILDRAGLDDSGSFFDRDGSIVPW